MQRARLMNAVYHANRDHEGKNQRTNIDKTPCLSAVVAVPPRDSAPLLLESLCSCRDPEIAKGTPRLLPPAMGYVAPAPGAKWPDMIAYEDEGGPRSSLAQRIRRVYPTNG